MLFSFLYCFYLCCFLVFFSLFLQWRYQFISTYEFESAFGIFCLWVIIRRFSRLLVSLIDVFEIISGWLSKMWNYSTSNIPNQMFKDSMLNKTKHKVHSWYRNSNTKYNICSWFKSTVWRPCIFHIMFVGRAYFNTLFVSVLRPLIKKTRCWGKYERFQQTKKLMMNDWNKSYVKLASCYCWLLFCIDQWKYSGLFWKQNHPTIKCK